jgi:hypothetical protein
LNDLNCPNGMVRGKGKSSTKRGVFEGLGLSLRSDALRWHNDRNCNKEREGG